MFWFAAPAAAQDAAASSRALVLFETSVRPTLFNSCAECHSRVTRGGLKVDSREALLEGGRTGPAIIPGDPDGSLLIQVIRHEIEDLEMPQDAPALDARSIAAMAEWIEMGAPWPEASPDVAFAAAVASTGHSPSQRLFLDGVLPVLEQTCYSCHTDDERGGLRLDSREAMLAGGGRGPAIDPGNPEGSLLVRALRHADPDLQMPRNGDQLSEAEIEGFVAWIESGAEWADAAGPIAVPRRGVSADERSHWSFQPLRSVDPPPAGGDGETADDAGGWAKTPIDRFIAMRHEEAGVRPVEPADKRELIRRATYDLIGLPPTPEEIADFLADDAPDAFEKVVERLLDSPHYGERWGRHWLDVTRFGEDDTRGLARDGSGRERYPMAYLHRDWVVDAFNDDMPYDRFVIGHLAADLLEDEEDRDELLPGLGFLGQGPWYYDVADPPVARADERHDRVDVTSRAFLGVTVGCARCHDHKYDPIGIHDYYALAGIFNNTDYHEYLLAEKVKAEAYRRDQEFIETLEDGLGDYMGTESDQLAQVLALQTSDYAMGAWKVTGKEQIPVDVVARRDRLDLEALQRWIDFLDDEPKHYPFLIPWQEMIADEGGTEERAQALADSLERLVLEVVAEQKELEERNEKIIARGTPLEETKSTPMPNGFESFFDQHQLELETMDRERFNFYLDVFRFDLDNELDTFFGKPALLRFSGWSLERQLSRVASAHIEDTRETIEELEEGLPDIDFVMGVKEKDDEDLVDIPLHLRGSPLNLGERVPRGFPRVLADPDDDPYTEGSGRLQLARDIVEHPITARVLVNRVWAWHMGEGIVRTPSNFGFAGAEPTHPELLEYLAKRFVDGGMSIKQLHRDIMSSAVYQLASSTTTEYDDIDPENRWFWRFDRRRLEAEEIRDALLMVSGTLDPEIGGPSMPLDRESHDRRTLYGEVSRFQLNEYLQTFDFPNPNLSAERRFSTNVPLQSLYFMNSPFVEAQMDALVRRLADETAPEVVVDAGMNDGPDDPEQEAPDDDENGEGDDDAPPEHFEDRAMIEAAYPLLYSRDASEEEVALGLEFLEAQRASWAEQLAEAAVDGEGAEEAGPDEEDLADEETVEEQDDEDDPELLARRASLAAWVQYTRALVSAAEFRFIG
jgi:mono/diheme cytochrome c family protein